MSRPEFSPRSLLALCLILGLSYFVLKVSNDFYYKPLCERYAESQQLIYESYTSGWRKKGWPAECFLSNRNRNSKRVETSAIEHTPADNVRWILSWITTIGGMGGSVWLTSVVGGFKPKGKSRKRKSR